MISRFQPPSLAGFFSDFRISELPEQAIDVAAALIASHQRPQRITGGLLMALLFIAVGLAQILLYSACWAIGTAQGLAEAGK